MLKVLSVVAAVIVVLVIAFTAKPQTRQDVRNAEAMKAREACLETVKSPLGGSTNKLGGLDRVGCVDRAFDLADPNKDPTNCDAMRRDERGVWVWAKTPEERAACQAGSR